MESQKSLASVGSHRAARLLNRAQSADVQRSRSDVPQRSVRSAGARTATITLPSATEEELEQHEDEKEEELDQLDQETIGAPSQDKEAESREDTNRDDVLEFYPMSDYDETLKKYGWRAEVPGDPFNLK